MPVGLAVVLHEYEIPDLYHQRIIPIHQLLARDFRPLGLWPEVDVDLRARTAGPRIAHHPEVILHRALQNPRPIYALRPELVGLIVARHPMRRVALEYRNVQPASIYPQHLHQQLPRPGYRLPLEVVAKAPVAQHLKHGVVVGIMPHLLQVVVLARDPQALLRIDRTPPLGLHIAQDDILELVHPRISEHEGWVALDHHRRRGDNGVPFSRKKIEECLPYLVGSHGTIGFVATLSSAKLIGQR